LAAVGDSGEGGRLDASERVEAVSHASGEVILNGKTVGHFEYNGTSDVVIPWIYDTKEEMLDNWRRPDPWPSCACKQPPTPVRLYTIYGDGFNWRGKVCLTCKVVVDGLDPWPEEDHLIQEVDRQRGRPGLREAVRDTPQPLEKKE
jgi:hypothetical protein